MEYINLLATLFTLLGVSALSIAARTIAVVRTCDSFNFTKKTRLNCLRRYMELPYKVDDEEKGRGRLTRTLYKTVFKDAVDKIIFIIGKTGIGKTCLINRFILKYNIYSLLKGRKIIRIFGMESHNLLEIVGDIEDKENTILIIDGLEEAFLYAQNSIDSLNELNANLKSFFKVIISVNSDFYKENRSVLNDIYYRNADQEKIMALKIFLLPFTDKMIVKYINRNFKISRQEKRIVIDRAMQNKDFFSRPLMLSFILFFDNYKGKYASVLDTIKYIYDSSLEWEMRKFTKAEQAEIGMEKTAQIMNRLSNNFISGKSLLLRSNYEVNNVLLVYDKKKNKYRFQNNVFLYYNTIQKYYSKLCRRISRLDVYLHISADFRSLYFEKIMQRHEHLLVDNDMASLQFEKLPYLNVKNSAIFNEMWFQGLIKSLAKYPVQLHEIVLSACQVQKITKKYIDKKYLDLHDMDIDERQLEWWAELSIESLNISNTNVKEIRIPKNWYSVKEVTAENLKLRYWNQMNHLSKLKELDFSGIMISDIADLHQIKRLPDEINLDLSNCNIVNDVIPSFVFNTSFNNLYLDYNKLMEGSFVSKIKFNHMNISNNPVLLDRESMNQKKVLCRYYFDDDNITDYLCENNSYLDYKKAVNLEEVDISDMTINNMRGLENLPKLKCITMNLFQTPLLVKDMYANSSLEIIKIKTYYLNGFFEFKKIGKSIEDLITHEENLSGHEEDCGIVCSAVKSIMDFTCKFFKYDPIKDECQVVIVGTKELIKFLDIDLGVFYRRILDVHNYAIKFWNADTYIDEKEKIIKEYNKIAAENYEQRLKQIFDELNITPVAPVINAYDLQKFFVPICNILNTCITHDNEEMEIKLSSRIGKKIKVGYILPNGKIIGI